MAPHMTNRLGEILVHKGFITPEQLSAAIKEQKKYRQRQNAAHPIAILKTHPPLLTVACTGEIQRALRENQHGFSLHNFSDTHGEKMRTAANDSDFKD